MCSAVVDGPEGETAVEKALRREAVKAILNGAAIFYPNKQSRRDKLFHMMVRLCVFTFYVFVVHLWHPHCKQNVRNKLQDILKVIQLLVHLTQYIE